MTPKDLASQHEKLRVLYKLKTEMVKHISKYINGMNITFDGQSLTIDRYRRSQDTSDIASIITDERLSNLNYFSIKVNKDKKLTTIFKSSGIIMDMLLTGMDEVVDIFNEQFFDKSYKQKNGLNVVRVAMIKRHENLLLIRFDDKSDKFNMYIYYRDLLELWEPV